MNRAYWLLSLASAVAALSVACSPKFSSCDVRSSCPASGGDATVAGIGGGSAGEEADGEAGGSAGEGGAADLSPALFGHCSSKGASACVEHAGAQRLACDGKIWQAGTTCAADELCDSSDGSCAAIVSECSAQQPGAVVCRDDTRLVCGPDLVTVSVAETCVGLCELG